MELNPEHSPYFFEGIDKSDPVKASSSAAILLSPKEGWRSGICSAGTNVVNFTLEAQHPENFVLALVFKSFSSKIINCI